MKKHTSNEMVDNWETVHFIVLASVDRDMGTKYYRRCGIPGATNLKATDEMQTRIENDIAMFLITMIVMNLIK